MYTTPQTFPLTLLGEQLHFEDFSLRVSSLHLGGRVINACLELDPASKDFAEASRWLERQREQKTWLPFHDRRGYQLRVAAWHEKDAVKQVRFELRWQGEQRSLDHRN